MSRLSLALAALALASAASASPAAPQSSSRSDRGFFTFITIATETCNTGDAKKPHGTCFAARDCANMKGTVMGKCAQGLGVCCYLTRTCGEPITTNLTSFVNPSYPSADTTGNNRCQTEVQLIAEGNVCQLRLDFITMDVAGPNTDSGECDKDLFMVTGTTTDSRVPKICGENTGQHMYVDVKPRGGNPQLTMDLGLQAASRSWEIKVTQIKCESVQRAPSGCLQYFNTTSGNVKSFNYVGYTGTELAAGEVEGVHLASQDYRVCIAPQPGFCFINWERASTTSFIMTGEIIGVTADAIGTSDAGWPTSEEALTCPDYVVIPGGSHLEIGATDQRVNRDRFCGSYFPKVSSTLHPFMLHVVTDFSETTTTATQPQTNNVGFSLNYRMKVC